MVPSIEYVKNHPELLSFMFKFTFVLSFWMFNSFIAELTTMNPATRFKVFKAELVKVFWTIILYYFLALVFT